MWIQGIAARFVYDYLVGPGRASPAGIVPYTLFLLSFLLFTAFADYALAQKIAVVAVPALTWVSASPRRGARGARPTDAAPAPLS
jgi:hypothetical protein